MKRTLLLLLVAALCFTVAGIAAAQESPLHPVFPLLDASGANVVDSGAPISTLMTCGSCHDANFITSPRCMADGGRVQPGRCRPTDCCGDRRRDELLRRVQHRAQQVARVRRARQR